jgi:4-hydroxy-tetrahydrodipicolinate synthase
MTEPAGEALWTLLKQSIQVIGEYTFYLTGESNPMCRDSLCQARLCEARSALPPQPSDPIVRRPFRPVFTKRESSGVTRVPMPPFRGSITALITPFKDGKVDDRALQKLVAWQIDQGTHGLVPCGTTGESPTLTHDEHRRVVEICVEAAAGRVPVIAGTGSNATAEAVELTRHAKIAGADGVLVVTPYYNKPTQEGLYLHFKAINDCADMPIVIYNIPGRSVIDMSVETMTRLFKLKNIVGLKDATANMARASQQRAALGTDFIQLSGEDATALGFMAHGGQGCISVTANVAPALCAEFQLACLAGNFRLALQLQDRLMPLHDALFVESNPGPVKYAASKLGLCNGETRLPLAPLAPASRKKVDEALSAVGLVLV